MFNIKAFALFTHHPVLLKALPQQVREQLPKEAFEKKRLYPKDLPEQAHDLVWSMFESALRPLADAGKLGAVLFQFPHWFVRSRANIEYLRELAERFPFRPAVEFRGGGWMEEDRASARWRCSRSWTCPTSSSTSRRASGPRRRPWSRAPRPSWRWCVSTATTPRPGRSRD